MCSIYPRQVHLNQLLSEAFKLLPPPSLLPRHRKHLVILNSATLIALWRQIELYNRQSAITLGGYKRNSKSLGLTLDIQSARTEISRHPHAAHAHTDRRKHVRTRSCMQRPDLQQFPFHSCFSQFPFKVKEAPTHTSTHTCTPNQRATCLAGLLGFEFSRQAFQFQTHWSVSKTLRGLRDVVAVVVVTLSNFIRA